MAAKNTTELPKDENVTKMILRLFIIADLLIAPNPSASESKNDLEQSQPIPVKSVEIKNNG